MCIRIDSRFQKSKAIKGSVFEYLMGGTKNDYIVISDTDYNMDNGMAICSMIVPYTDRDKDNKYAIPFEMSTGNMFQKWCVLTNTQFIFKVVDLKVYKYHAPQELIDEIDRRYMDIIFGEKLYKISECRQAVAEDDIRLRVKYENESSSKSVMTDATNELPQVENYNMTVEDQQNYYAQMYGNTDITDVTPIAKEVKAEEKQNTIPGKSEAFNTVLSKEFTIEDLEVKPTSKKPTAKLNKAEESNKKKARASKSKSGANIVLVGKGKKKEKDLVPDIIEAEEKPAKKRSYMNRSQIWEKPELFLLDVATSSRNDILEMYSINTWSQCKKIINKAIRICKENNIDISFMEEKI